MATRVLTLVLLLVVAVGLAMLGRWGRRSPLDLVSTALPEDDRERKAAVVRRGGIVCYAGAAVMAAAGVLAVL